MAEKNKKSEKSEEVTGEVTEKVYMYHCSGPLLLGATESDRWYGIAKQIRNMENLEENVKALSEIYIELKDPEILGKKSIEDLANMTMLFAGARKGCGQPLDDIEEAELNRRQEAGEDTSHINMTCPRCGNPFAFGK